MAKTNQIGVIGLGKFGRKCGESLTRFGQIVIGVDNHAENVKLARDTIQHVFQADATDKEALAQLGFADMSQALVSVGDSIAASTMITMYLKELGIPKVWVKAIHPDHERLLRKVGADEVVIPEYMAAKQIANRIVNPGFIDKLPFDKSMVIQELPVKKWAGKTLRDLNLTNRYGIQVIAVKNHDDDTYSYIPKADRLLQHNDTLVVIGNSKTIGDLDA